MKKTTILVLLAAAVTLASCTSYTCPTYSKISPKKVEKETRI